jgi:hypothetical protein
VLVETLNKNNMTNLIAQITKQVAAIQGCKFASLTYLSKSAGELSRYTVELGFSYHKLVEKSVTALEILMQENETVWNPLQKQAAAEIMASFKKTLAAHAIGEQNEDYTKKDQYIPLGNGASLNTTDNTIQLFGLVQSKKVLVEGVHKKVNSRPLTIEKRKIEKLLPVSKFREFALDLSQVAQVKVSGETFEMEPVSAAGYSFTVNPATAAQPISV